MKTYMKNSPALNTLFAAALLFAAAPTLAANETTGDLDTQVYTYIYSPERAVGSFYHSFDLASTEIRQQAGSAAKSSSIADIDSGMSALQQQFAYALYVPKQRKLQTAIDWRDFA